MPISFEEVTGEVAPPPAAQRTSAPAAEPKPAGQDPAECFRQQWQLRSERERRLIAD